MGHGIDGLSAPLHTDTDTDTDTDADTDTDSAPGLFLILRTMQAEQAAAAAVRAPSAPFHCGDARLHGGHDWQPDYAFTARRILACECGARARVDHEGRLFEEFGYGPPPAPPTKEAA